MNYDFSHLIKSTANARLRIRYLALAHFFEGKSRTEIAQFLKVSRTSVNKWVKTYLDFGLEGLQEKPHTGRPHQLSTQQLSQLKKFVTDAAIKEHGGRLQAKDVAIYIAQNFGIQYRQANIYRILHDIGLNWITTRSKHPKLSPKAQDDFKKIPNRNDP